jgi:nifR3 family TIM-barrel protein
MGEAAKRARELCPDFIDINMGCPAPKVAGHGGGSALMKDISLAGEIVSAVVNAVDIPVTVKIRTGWDSNSINCVEMAKRLEASGASLICVHGRTREQQYAPYADWSHIARVKEALSIPVIGNGDIFEPNDALKMMNETGCDGVMIGRGALGNPWIFENVINLFEGREARRISTNEVVDTALWHLALMIENKGERAGIAESRKHLGWYMKGVRGAAELRNRINCAESLNELTEILNTLKE